ncbi:MAG: glycosyltransferase family 9 protein [Phycisphaerales bacterium]|nr:glycosyltransferase family 9 protein [Phycisphaerales bacterium]
MPTPDPKRILIIRPSALGDICRSTPILAALKAKYPNAKIDWMVRDNYTQAIEHHPDLNQVIPFKREQLGKQCRHFRFGPLIKWLKTLRKNNYDMVLDCQGLARSGFFSRATGAKLRYGFKDSQELGWLFHNKRINAPKELHSVDRMLKLAQAAGADISNPNITLHAGQDELSQVVIEYPEPYAVLAPTSAWPAKCWPIERFTQLAKELTKNKNIDRVIIVGGPGERLHCAPLLELAKDHPKITDRVGSTSIALLMAIIARSKLTVANDSAALHMAVGFHRPLVALLGPTDPKKASPYNREQDIIQHIEPNDEFYFRDNRSAQMIQRITPTEVLTACNQRLNA